MLQEAQHLDPILIMMTSPALIVYRSQLLEPKETIRERGFKNRASQYDSCYLIIKLCRQLRLKEKGGWHMKAGRQTGTEWRENVMAGSFNCLEIASPVEIIYLSFVAETQRKHPVFVMSHVSGSLRSETNSQLYTEKVAQWLYCGAFKRKDSQITANWVANWNVPLSFGSLFSFKLIWLDTRSRLNTTS